MIDRLMTACAQIYPGTNQSLSTLIYHRVLDGVDYLQPGETTKEIFQWQMSLIAKYFVPLSLGRALTLLEQGRLPRRAVCVTFDDGYADNLTVALPIMKALGVPATVFVATDYLDGGIMWNDSIKESIRSMSFSDMDLSEVGMGSYSCRNQEQKFFAVNDIIRKVKYFEPCRRGEIVDCIKEYAEGLHDDLMLTTDQLNLLIAERVDIGAHTKSHPILECLDHDDALEEIAESKKVLEALTGEEVKYFAYPNGRRGVDYSAAHRDMVVSAGYRAAVSTDWGVSSRHTDAFQLRRFTPWDRTSRRFLFRMLMNYQYSD